MSTLEAIIFDIDGVIVETENLHRLAYNRVFEALDLEVRWSPEDYARLLPMVGGKKIRAVVDSLDVPNRDALAKQIYEMKTDHYRRLVRELFNDRKLEPRPGVLRLIKEIKRAGMKLAAASTCEKQGAIVLLNGALGEKGLAGLDALCAGDDVQAKKPAPDIYLAALKQIDVSPQTAVAIEDTIHGLQAAHAAGMKCIVTPSEYTVGLDFSEAELCVETLDGGSGHPPVTLDLLRSLVATEPPGSLLF